MIMTECCYCDESFVVAYEAGDKGAGLYVRVVCVKCGETNYVQLVSLGGATYPEGVLDFRKVDNA